MTKRAFLACLVALTFAAVAQEDPDGEVELRLEVQSVHDSLSFTREWWGETDPHYWISTDGDPHDLLRFEGLDVPQGARITRARLTVWSFNAASDDPEDWVTVWMEATDHAAPVEGPADAWSRMGEGGDGVRWPTTAAGRDQPQPSPDLSPLLQEIVSRPGWEAGNAVLFFARANPSPAHDGRQMHSYYTGAAGSTRPILEVAYTPARAGVAEVLSGDERFATFVRALRESGVWDTITGRGQVTVFAPTEEAFAALGDEAVEDLFADASALERFVRIHLVRDDVIVAEEGRLLRNGSVNPVDEVLALPEELLADSDGASR